MGNGLNWKSVMASLQSKCASAADADIFLLDARNHGASEFSDSMSYSDMALDIKHFMEQNGIETATLVGHSMGGKAAMAACLLHPHLVKRAIVVDIAPASYVNDPRWQPNKYIEAMDAVDFAKIERRDDANEAMKKVLPDAKLRLFLLTNLRREGSKMAGQRDQWSWRVNINTIRENIFEIGGFAVDTSDGRTPKIPCDKPVLFVRGADSYYLQDQTYLSKVREYFENFTLATIPMAGHWAHTDNTESFVNTVAAWLDDK
jgi:esterase